MRGFMALLILTWMIPASFAQRIDRVDGESLQTSSFRPGQGGGPDLPQVVQEIIRETNAFRSRHGRSRLQVNSQLTYAARYFAEYLAKMDKLSHTADGHQPGERARKRGYDYCIEAENIAYEFNSAGFTSRQLAERFVQGWARSPEHRKNMLDPDVMDLGVAVARSARTGYFYAVMELGRPKSKAITFRVENRSDTTVAYTVGERTFSLGPRYIRTHESCRSEDVLFRFPGNKSDTRGKSQTVRPANGDRFVITENGPGLGIRKD